MLTLGLLEDLLQRLLVVCRHVEHLLVKHALLLRGTLSLCAVVTGDEDAETLSSRGSSRGSSKGSSKGSGKVRAARAASRGKRAHN